MRHHCQECDIHGYIANITRHAVYISLKRNKTQKSVDYLGCSIQEFKQHIEVQFKEGMTWENHGKWHIDHIIPLKYNNPSIEEIMERLHYKNTQPLWARENRVKGNRFIG
jgi:5-methylcytosine-specific restriction endonuclease McrA